MMGKIRKNEEGFSAVEMLIVLVVVALIGGVGYFVYKSHHKSVVTPVATATTKPTTTPAKTTPTPTSPVFSTLPSDWSEYKSDDNGLRLGFPKEWGVLGPTTLHTPDYRDDTKSLQGQLVVAISKKDGFTVVARKYGATIKPSSDGKSWIVAEENPANVDGYKVGDTYKANQQKVNGGTAINLTFDDEDCTQTRWLLELKNSYAVVTIPELCAVGTDTGRAPISASNKDAYTKLTTDFLSSITVY